MSNRVWESLYTNLRTVLKAGAQADPIVFEVPVANIFPANDPGEPRAGNLCTFAMNNAVWDAKARRGQGDLQIQIESVKNAVHAGILMDQFRDLVGAKKLSGSGVTVHLMKEQPNTSDDVLAPRNANAVTSVWKIKLIAS